MRKIALAFVCLPAACTAHGRGAQASQVTSAGSRAKYPHGRVSSDRRPKDTFGKLMLKQSKQLVSADRKPKETFGKLLLSLNTPATPVPHKSSDPRTRSSTHNPSSASSRHAASSRQSSSRQSGSRYSSTGYSSSPEHSQRQSEVDKRKRSTHRTPGKRPGDLPPPRAQTTRSHYADSSAQGSMFQGDFYRLALGTVVVLLLTLVYIFVNQRNNKAAHDSKEGRNTKKNKVGKQKTIAKAQKPVQRQAKTAATEAPSRSTSKSTQKVVDTPARSTSKNVEHAEKKEVKKEVKKVDSCLNVENVENVSVENVNVEKEEDKKLGSRLSAKKARRKVRKADEKHQVVDEQVEEPADEQADEQASSSQQFESSSVIADEQTADFKTQIGTETSGLSSGVVNGHTDVEVSELQCAEAGADRNASSCRVKSVAVSPDSTVASSGESTDEDSDQVRAEYIKNDENDLLDGQTTTASSASREVPSSQHLCAASPTSSLASAEKPVIEDDEDDEDRHVVQDALPRPPCSVTEVATSTSQAQNLQAYDAKEAPDCDQEFSFQPPLAKEPEMEPEMTTEMESKNDGLPSGVSFTGGPSFTDGRQVFTPCVSQDGQQWFTDGKHLYTAMYMPVPLDTNGASSPSTSMPYVEASPSHTSGTYQSPCWQPPNPAAPGYASWQPSHAGW